MSESACCRSPLTDSFLKRAFPCRGESGVRKACESTSRPPGPRACDVGAGFASIASRGRTSRKEEPAQPATPRSTLQQGTPTPPKQGESDRQLRARFYEAEGATTGQRDGSSGSAHLAARRTSPRTRAAGSAMGCQTNSRRWPELAGLPARPTSRHQGRLGRLLGRAQTAGRKIGGDEEEGTRVRRPLLTNIESKLPSCKRRKQNQDHGTPRWTAHWRTWRERSSRSNVLKKRWNAQDELHAAKTHKAEAERQVQKVRELMAQDPRDDAASTGRLGGA